MKHHMRTASPTHAVVSAAVGARCLRACAVPQFSSIVVQFQHQFGKHRGRPDVNAGTTLCFLSLFTPTYML